MGKGHARRPAAISREEENLRWKYATHQISLAEFEIEYEELKKQGKIYRRF